MEHLQCCNVSSVILLEVIVIPVGQLGWGGDVGSVCKLCMTQVARQPLTSRGTVLDVRDPSRCGDEGVVNQCLGFLVWHMW